MSILEQFISEQQQQQPFNDGPPGQPGGGPPAPFGNPNFRGGPPGPGGLRFRPPGPFDNTNGGPPRGPPGGFRGPAPFGDQRPPFQDNRPPFQEHPQHFNERPSPFWDQDRGGRGGRGVVRGRPECEAVGRSSWKLSVKSLDEKKCLLITTTYELQNFCTLSRTTRTRLGNS